MNLWMSFLCDTCNLLKWWLQHEKRSPVNGLTWLTLWACFPPAPLWDATSQGPHLYYGTCHSNLSLFSSLAFKKCPKKFKVIFCKIIQSKATGILNLPWEKENSKQKKLGTLQMLCSMCLQTSREEITFKHYLLCVTTPQNLGSTTRTQTFHHLKVTRTKESRFREIWGGKPS